MDDYYVEEHGYKYHRKKYTWSHQLLRLLWLALIPVGLLIPYICKDHSEIIENIYSRCIYPCIAAMIGSFSASIRSSLAEVLIIIIISILIVLLLVRLSMLVFGKLSRRSHNRIRLFSYIISISIFAGVMLNLFYLLWGINYFREPVASSLNFDVKRQYSVDDLAKVYELLAHEAAELREQVAENENGIFIIENINETYAAVAEAYEKLGEANAVFRNEVFTDFEVPRAKSVKLSEQMSALGISGIFIPFTAEMNINVDQPGLYIPASAAHETAHYLGFAREDEANFIAFYLSRFTSDVTLHYSSVMNALVNCGNALCKKDSEMFLTLRAKLYTDGMNRDLTDYRNYLAKYSGGGLQEFSDRVNDAYLKHNGQQDGVESYGRMVELLLAYYDSIGGI